ncbi:MAG: Rpn family recombination-promoting nuclease/putative transposase [Bacteroidetes bacterium]|nr:MAG: Rpn family recombination-promoting nuclease/putative transposase [Bacteroidota bacterium]
MQFADIKNDIAFRKIFGNENKKEILISFLNAVLKLEGNKQISWVEILNPYQMPIVLGAKSTILDVKSKDKAGNEYIVEMQVTEKAGFAKRAVFYSAKSYSSQLNVGDDYYKLKPTIFIGILNFVFLEGANYLSRHLILDAETQEHKLKDLDFNFIELPKFNKTESELQNLVEKWIYFIKNAENLTVLPPNLDDEGLKSAYTEADRHLWTKAELDAYAYARMRETDEKAREMLVEERGRNQGKMEGKNLRNIEVAKNAINKGLDNETIAAITGLTVEQIEQLRKETKE